MMVKVDLPLTASRIEQLLPHRVPMRLVDNVTEASTEPPLCIVARKHIRPDEPCFTGHYPGRPIFPGTFILEGLTQTGLLLFQLSGRLMQPDEVPVLASVEGRFLSPVFPGDTLVYRVDIEKRTDLAAIFHGTASVGQTVVARGEFSFGVKSWQDLKSR